MHGQIYKDHIGGMSDIESNLGYGNFSAFANHSGDFKKIMGIGGYGDHFQPGWEAASGGGAGNFINTVTTIVNDFNLDGVDLDWEPLSLISNNNLQTAFITMVANLKTALGQDKIIGFPITVDQEQIEAFGPANWLMLDQYIDEIALMGYDMHGAFDKPQLTGLQSTLYEIDSECDATGFSTHGAAELLQSYGISPSKISLGYPSYGRGLVGVEDAKINTGFSSHDSNANLDSESGIASYTWIQDQISNGCAQEYSVIGKKSPVDGSDAYFGAYSYCPDSKTFYSYDNVESVAQKAQYVVDHNLQGAFTWLIENDLPADNPNALYNIVSDIFAASTSDVLAA